MSLYEQTITTPLPFQEQFDRNQESNRRLMTEADTTLGRLEAHIAKEIFRPDEEYNPNGIHFESLRNLYTNTEATTLEDQVAGLGIDIGQQVVRESKNPKEMLLGFLHALTSVDFAKIGLVGIGNEQDSIEYAVFEYITATVLDNLPYDEKTQKVLASYVEVLNEMATQDPFFGWPYVKAQRLLGHYDNFNGLKLLASDFETTSSGHEVEIDSMTNELIAEAMKHRKYGIKPAYTESSIDGSWLFYDFRDFAKSVGHSGEAIDAFQQVAMVFHSSKQHFESLKIRPETREFGNSSKITHVGGHLQSVDTHMSIFKDGTIALDQEGLFTIDRILRNSPAQLRAVKAEIISKFFDLSMPIAGQRRAPSGHFTELQEATDKIHDPILLFLVPRIKRVRELEMTTSDVRREYREHGVTWHVRELPDGWHASPEASAKAEQFGIVLEANETFVRAHTRGKNNPVQGHRVVKRFIANAAQNA